MHLANAQTVEQFAGIWSGTYTCGATQAGLTLVLQPQSNYALTGTLSFYPLPNRSDVVPGSHGVRMQIKGADLFGGYGAWIQRPKNQKKQLGFTGKIVSGTKLSLQISAPGCKTFDVVKFEGAPADAPRVVTKEAAKAPEVARQTPEKKAAGARQFVGRWEGPGFCLNGPAKFVLLVLPEMDGDGFNATLTIVQQASVQADDIAVRGVFVYDDDIRFPVRFEPDPNASMLPRQRPTDFLGRVAPGGKLEGQSREAGCGTVQLNRVSPDAVAETKTKPAPPAYAALEGSWDGAIYDRDNRAHQVAFTVVKSQGGSENRVFDVAVLLDGTQGQIAFAKTQGDNVSIVNILNKGSLPVALKGPITSKIMESGSVEYFVFATQGDADGVGLAWRRPQGRGQTTLQEVCKSEIAPFATARDQARNTARDLRIEYFPALSGLDEDKASVREAYISTLANVSDAKRADFARLATECMVASPGFYNYFNRNLLTGIVDMPAVEKLRLGLIRNRELRGGWTLSPGTIPSPTLVGETDAAEAALATVVASVSSQQNIEEVLKVLADNVKTLERARPSVVETSLRPVSAQLARLGQVAAEDALASRKARAEARFPKGSPMPSDIGSNASSFQELLSGTKTRFSGDEISLFGGLVAGAIDKCGQPTALADRLQLLGFLFQGVDRALFGESYATGDLLDTLRGSLQGTLMYDEGAGLAEKLGCNSQFLAAALADLVDATKTRVTTADGRASLFVRSCSLDRELSQCQCLARTMQSAMPGINDLRYDRSQLASLAARNPSTAIQVATVCGVGNY